MAKNDVMVSIVCITYNHENYITQAIEGFINQETDFKYEIIIHDDCSTDNTINIIKKYEDKFPDLIFPIYEKENQYSLGIDVVDICFKKCRGKYIALCEGDDFWCDNHKLQEQFEFMEKNLNCSLITNNYQFFDEKKKKLISTKSKYNGSRYYSTDEIILGDGSLFCTNSMFFRSKYIKSLPKFYYNAPIGDFPLTIYLSLNGDVYFMDKVMSVYRINSIGSWSSSMSSGDVINKQNIFYEKLSQMFDEINLVTKNKYENSIRYFLLEKRLNILLETKQFDVLKENISKYKELYKKGNIKRKIKNFVKIRLPKLFFKIKYGRR